MHRPMGRQRHGLTLAELLVAMTVMTLLFGAVSLVYFAGMRIWMRSSSTSQALAPAYLVVTRLQREVKNAYAVTISASGDAITFRLPKRNASGVNITPFQLGREISYYRSNASGTVGQPGTLLWRKQVDGTSGAVTYTKIADNVTAMSFQTDALKTGRVFAIYSTTITVVGKEKRQTATSTFSATIAVRNPTR